MSAYLLGRDKIHILICLRKFYKILLEQNSSILVEDEVIDSKDILRRII